MDEASSTLGVKEQMIFPEINYDMVDRSTAWTSPSSPPRIGDDQALARAARAGDAIPRWKTSPPRPGRKQSTH
jgi:hypothetical protein